MKSSKYVRAREAVWALNRFLKPGGRPRRGERKSHAESDRQTARSLWHDPNILGYGVGPKISGDSLTPSEFCVVFFVRRKLPKSRLRNLMIVPKRLFLNTLGLRVGTDVQVWGGPPVAHGRVCPGMSIGDLVGNSGTVSLVVQDMETKQPKILGCSHVMAACGLANVGDEIECPVDLTSDPGPNVVGHLLRFTKIDPASPCNEVDAAVADVADGIELSNNIPRLGTPSGIRVSL